MRRHERDDGDGDALGRSNLGKGCLRRLRSTARSGSCQPRKLRFRQHTWAPQDPALPKCKEVAFRVFIHQVAARMGSSADVFFYFPQVPMAGVLDEKDGQLLTLFHVGSAAASHHCRAT